MKKTLNKLDDWSRRKFLNVAAKAFLGVGLSQVMPTNLAAQPQTRMRTARNVIYLYMAGGMSHIDTLDPKPGRDVQGPVESIKTNVDGIILSQHFPELAKHMDKAAIIRSMNSNQGAHEPASYFMHTAYAPRGTIKHPGLGPWLQKFSGRTNSTLPGNVRIGGGSNAYGGAGFFEPKYAPLYIGDPDKGLKHAQRYHGVTDEEFQSRRELAEWMDLSFHKEYNTRQTRAYTDMYHEALRLMNSEDLAAFDISKEHKSLQDAYGNTSFGKGCLLARRLIEHDVRFVEVVYGGWDTHVDNFTEVADKTQVLDQVLSVLLKDLEIRGLLDETLVVLATEFGRSPKINQNDGRNHHPQAFSCLLAGGGVKGGQVHGATDAEGSEIAESLVSVEDFNATIAYAMGLPLEKVLYSSSGRPFTVANKGQAVTGLF